MKTDSLSRRLEDLERQQEGTPKIRLRWYDDPEPSNPNAIHIKLRWLDECRGGLQ
jgi:hypothetical protein